MTIRPPPVDWDRHAQVVARSIASLDRSRLPGSTTQFTAIIHEAIVDAMMMAAEDTEAKLRNCTESQTGTSHEWDDDGERCVVCGDKDCYAGADCKGRSSC